MFVLKCLCYASGGCISIDAPASDCLIDQRQRVTKQWPWILICLTGNKFRNKGRKKTSNQMKNQTAGEKKKTCNSCLKYCRENYTHKGSFFTPFLVFDNAVKILTAIKIWTLCDVAIWSKDQLHILNNSLKIQTNTVIKMDH